MKKISFLILSTVFLSIFSLTGCKHELTKEEVQETKYYQNLKKKNKELNKNIKSLEEEVNELSKELLTLQEENANQENLVNGNKIAKDFFQRIAKSSLIQIEIGYTDEYVNPKYITNKALLKYCKSLIKAADLTANYTPEELKEEKGSGYIYTLYEEDDTVFQMEVYGDGYVVFSDLPGQVYYCENIISVGQAFLARRGNYPNSTLLHRMADSMIMLNQEKGCYSQEKCLEIANYIDGMEKTEVPDNRESTVKTECAFYSYGHKMTLKIYTTHLCITGWDGTEVWYQTENEMIKELQALIS